MKARVNNLKITSINASIGEEKSKEVLTILANVLPIMLAFNKLATPTQIHLNGDDLFVMFAKYDEVATQGNAIAHLIAALVAYLGIIGSVSTGQYVEIDEASVGFLRFDQHVARVSGSLKELSKVNAQIADLNAGSKIVSDNFAAGGSVSDKAEYEGATLEEQKHSDEDAE